MLKTYLAFIQNTIEPLIDKSNSLLKVLDASGLPLNEGNLRKLFTAAFMAHIVSEVLSGLIQITVAGIVCFTAWKICTI